MSDGNDTKSKEQLIAEIEALKAELAQRASRPVQPPAAEVSSAPVFSAPVTRRESLVRWVAPVILSLPVVQGVGAIVKSGTAHAQIATKAPRTAPTKKPTVAPTLTPTSTPTSKIGRCIPVPTVAPTLGMGAAPDSAPLPAGFVALGGARAVAARL